MVLVFQHVHRHHVEQDLERNQHDAEYKVENKPSVLNTVLDPDLAFIVEYPDEKQLNRTRQQSYLVSRHRVVEVYHQNAVLVHVRVRPQICIFLHLGLLLVLTLVQLTTIFITFLFIKSSNSSVESSFYS